MILNGFDINMKQSANIKVDIIQPILLKIFSAFMHALLMNEFKQRITYANFLRR